MSEYTTAEKYKILKANNYEFKTQGDTVTWGFNDSQGYVFGGKCDNMFRAVNLAFEYWESGL